MSLDNTTYLFSLSISFASWIIGFSLFWKHRMLIFWSSLLAFPLGFLSLLLIPDYWQPVFLFPTIMGFEDLLFCFFAGGMVWFPPLIFLHNRLNFKSSMHALLKRYLLIIIIGIILTTILFFLGLDNIENPFLVMLLFIIILLLKHRQKRLIMLFSMIGYPILYGSIFQVALELWPELVSWWTFKIPLLPDIFLRLPTIEWIWAMLFGTMWTGVSSFILDVKLSDQVNKGFK